MKTAFAKTRSSHVSCRLGISKSVDLKPSKNHVSKLAALLAPSPVVSVFVPGPFKEKPLPLIAAHSGLK